MTTEQRLSTLERKMDNLMKTIANLSIRQSTSHNNNESNISNVDGKAEMVGARVDEVNENVEMSDDTIQMLMEEVLPDMDANTCELSDMIDTILTDIIPDLFGDEE